MKQILAFLLIASVVSAQPTYELVTDVNYPDRSLKPLTFLQGATPHLLVSVQQKGATYTNIASDSMVFSYGTSGSASAFVQVTNTTITASAGTFLVPFTAANLNTNGSFWYTAMLKDSSGGMYYSGEGSLEIKATTVTGSPGSLSLTTPLSWDGFVYSDQNSAPAIGGSGITSATNGTTGQVTFSIAGAGTAWGTIIGTLSAQTDLNTELTNRYTKAQSDAITDPITASVGSNTTHRGSNGSDHSLVNTALQNNDTGVTLSGNGAGWTNLNASNLASGTIPAARYADTSASWYVDKTGSDSNDGRSIYAPKLTIQAAHDAGIGTGSRTIYVAPGAYAEALTGWAAGENVALVGSAAKNTTITSLTVATNHQGVTVQHISFYAAVTVGNQFGVPAGTPTGYEILLENVAFVEVALTGFTDSPVKIYGGTIEFKDCSFVALSPNFNSMGTASGDWIFITNAPSIHMHGTHFTITDMVNTNVSVTMLHDWGTGALREKNSSYDITMSGAFGGELRCGMVENNSSEKLFMYNEYHIVGDDETVGEGEALVAKSASHIRAESCYINISGFLKNYSYETYDTATMDVNGASDVNCTYQEAVAGSIDYTGSPEDNMMQWGSARFGKDGNVRTDWPLPSDVSGHNGIAYVAFGQASEIVSGESVTYNNMISSDDGDSMALVDSASSYMNLTMSITNWNNVDNDGENAAGTLFPQKAVRGNIENTANGSTGMVLITGAVVGETYVLEVLGSAAGPSKPCDDMTYWMDNSNTQTVDVVNNTSTLAMITNVATSTTMTLYCKEANGDDPYLNAFRMTGPSASGYVRTDGESVMTGNLNGGGQDITNANIVSIGTLKAESLGVINIDAAQTQPKTDSTQSLGGTGAEWLEIHGDTVYATTVTATGGEVSAEQLSSTDDASVSDDLSVGGDVIQTATTNSLTRQFYTPSNRWAYIDVYGTTTNIIFITPAR